MKKEFIVERNGKSFVLYAGLLDEAHSQGLREITTQLIQAPHPNNGSMAIAYAKVCTERGCYSGLGDASPENVSSMLSSCLIRMAETRAKARALRDAVNVGMASLEELVSGEEDVYEPIKGENKASSRGITPFKDNQGDPVKPDKLYCSNEDCGREMTKGQWEYSTRTFGVPLCPTCQRQRSKGKTVLSLNE